MCDHSDDGGNDDGIDDDGDADHDDDAKKNIALKFYPLHCANTYDHHDDNGK